MKINSKKIIYSEKSGKLLEKGVLTNFNNFETLGLLNPDPHPVLLHQCESAGNRIEENTIE
jgi:hypothetical protein